MEVQLYVVLTAGRPRNPPATAAQRGDVRIRVARPNRRRSALAVLLVGVLVPATCLVAQAPPRLTIGATIALLALSVGVSLLVWPGSSGTALPPEPLVVGVLCEVGLGAFLTVEGALHKVLVGDEIATVIGLAAAGIPLILQGAVHWLRRSG